MRFEKLKESTIYSLNPAEIVCSGPWLLHRATPVEKIIQSIDKSGQLVPVLLVRDGDKSLLVAGRARVEAARKLGKDVLAVYIEAEDDISRAVAHLEENGARTVDEFVKCATMRFLASRMEKKDISNLAGPLLDIKPKSRDMNFWLQWLELETDFDALLAAGNMPLASVSVLGRISAGDRASLVPFFEKVSWSRSNAVNFLTWIYETARRDNISISDLLVEHGLTPATESESPKDTVARLCRAAKKIRYPNLSELEKTHAKIVSEICAGTRWKIEPVGSFETGEVLVQTRFKSREMLTKAIGDLESISRFEGWEKVFNLGRDEQDN